jgi:hypothetical protein
MPVVSSSFRCAVCGNVAATVSLLPPGTPGPHEDLAGGPAAPGQRDIFHEKWRLSIVGGPVPMTVGPVADPARVTAALEQHDAAALAAIDPEYANFRCPTCPANYCEAHWSEITPELDEGFYDATWATCPRGHRVMLDD